MTIYILTDGDYSDYRIVGCFSSEDIADKACKILGGGIETYELDEVGKDNRWHYSVHIYFDGRSTRACAMTSTYNPTDRNVGHYDSDYWADVMAEDEQHAIKIASDKIAEYKANQR